MQRKKEGQHDSAPKPSITVNTQGPRRDGSKRGRAP